MRITNEPFDKRLRLDDRELRRNHIECIVILACFILFAWWLGGHILAAFERGNPAMVEVSNYLSGK